MPRPTADALDSRDDDWAVNEFDGQTHFSDDGQLYQPVDPTVYTGASDATFVPPQGALVTPTLRGDMPSAYDFLRRPGYASEFRPRVMPARLSTRDKRAVVSFENPFEPMPKGNNGSFASRRASRLAHQQKLQNLSNDGSGGDAQGFGLDDAGDLQSDIRGWAVNTVDLLKRSGAKLTPAQFNAIHGEFFKISQDARTPSSWTTVANAHKRIWQIWNQALGRRPNADYEGQLTRHMTGVGSAVAGRGGVLGALGNVASTIGSAATSVGKGVVGVVGGIARPVGALITSPIHLASDIAHGKNVLGSIKDTVKRDLSSVGDIAPYAQAVLSVVPGVGQGVNAAIAAGSAIAHGQPITDALVAGVKNMMPGGPLAQQALDTAYKVAKGGNVIASVAEGVRNQLPGGEMAKRAFDTGLALAHGANLQQTLAAQGKSIVNQAVDTAKGQAMSFLGDQISRLSPINNRVMSNTGPQFIGNAVESVTKLVSTPVQRVGHALLQNPTLRSLPIEELAKRLHVDTMTARDAVASLVSTVSKVGSPSVAHMAPALDVARRLSSGMNFDQALSHFASNMAPVAFNPNMAARRARPLVMSWFRGAQGFTPHIGEASGLDASGVAYLVESGDSMSKISSKLVGTSSRVGELIKANPQVKDPNKIFVGQRLNLPASWQTQAAVATLPPPITTRASPNASPSPMPTLPAPVPAAAPMMANAMPTISEKAQSSGAAVIAWQNILIRDGFAKAGTADGFFGPNTTARTKAWQSAHGVGADGVVGPGTWGKALATIATSVPGPVTPQAVSLPTPFGPVAIPPMLAPILTPTTTTISESPIAQPISVLAPSLAAPLPALPPALAPPIVTSTPTPEGPVTATQQGSSITVTQPPIVEQAQAAPPKDSGMGGILPIGLVLGALYFVGKGSGSRLF